MLRYRATQTIGGKGSHLALSLETVQRRQAVHLHRSAGRGGLSTQPWAARTEVVWRENVPQRCRVKPQKLEKENLFLVL